MQLAGLTGLLSRLVVAALAHWGVLSPGWGRCAGPGSGGVTVEQETQDSGSGRRRRANYSGGRAHRHEVKVSPEEEALLLRAALAQGVTVPRLLVESALTAERGESATERKQLTAELFKAIRLLAAVSNNVNQLARHANATGEIAAETKTTLAAVRRVAARVEETIEGLTF